MNTQDNSTVTVSVSVSVSFVESFESYAADSKMMGELKTRLEDTRKILEPVIRAHKIPVGDNKAWKAKREIFYPLVKELEWPEYGEDDIMDEEIKAEKKKAEARIVAWLGVIKTCLEYQILPTDKNADRLRKAKVWTRLNGNGMANPNWKPKEEPAKQEAASASTVPAPTQTTTTTPTPTTVAPLPQPTTPAPTGKATTPQKDTAKGEIPRANVNSSEEPIPPREHCGILLDQLFRNESFRTEYAPILALMLDVDKATLTRCLVQARDELNRGNK